MEGQDPRSFSLSNSSSMEQDFSDQIKGNNGSSKNNPSVNGTDQCKNNTTTSDHSISISNLEMEENKNVYTDEDLPLLKKLNQKWNTIVAVLSFTGLFSLLSINYKMNHEGHLTPEILFRKHPYTFYIFLLDIMLTFFSSINALACGEKYPKTNKAFSLLALTGVMLSFTILLWTLLPPRVSWAPLIFFVLTFGSVVYHCKCVNWLRTKIVEKLPW